jgi:hypothetical protein
VELRIDGSNIDTVRELYCRNFLPTVAYPSTIDVFDVNPFDVDDDVDVVDVAVVGVVNDDRRFTVNGVVFDEDDDESYIVLRMALSRDVCDSCSKS